MKINSLFNENRFDFCNWACRGPYLYRHFILEHLKKEKNDNNKNAGHNQSLLALKFGFTTIAPEPDPSVPGAITPAPGTSAQPAPPHRAPVPLGRPSPTPSGAPQVPPTPPGSPAGPRPPTCPSCCPSSRRCPPLSRSSRRLAGRRRRRRRAAAAASPEARRERRARRRRWSPAAARRRLPRSEQAACPRPRRRRGRSPRPARRRPAPRRGGTTWRRRRPRASPRPPSGPAPHGARREAGGEARPRAPLSGEGPGSAPSPVPVPVPARSSRLRAGKGPLRCPEMAAERGGASPALAEEGRGRLGLGGMLRRGECPQPGGSKEMHRV